MAKMYPKNIELYEATLSEKKVFKALENQLPDTYTIFYSVQWVDENNGVKKESECDFLIFNEQEGFLTCEVKGGRGYKKENNKFILIENDGERELKRSPMEQAEESSRYFYKLYTSEYNEQFNGIYGSISIFPFYKVDDPVLLDHRTKDIVLDIDDMDNLAKKIKKVFLFYKGQRNSFGSLTKNQRLNFVNLINKKIATEATAGSIIEAKEFELSIVNRVQDNLIFFLKNYKKTFISGGAGTGKTWIAYKFAKQSSLEGKRTLFTTLNKQLIELFKQKFNGYDNIDILSFEELLAKDGISSNCSSEKLLEKYNGVAFSKYDSIIVDEAQDFDEYQALIISEHLKSKESELRVFYDLTQNVYHKDFKDGFDIDNPPFVLRENLRNTSSIYDWATNQTSLGKDVITNQIIGPLPITHTFKKEYELKKYLETEIVNMIDHDGVPVSSIVIITDHDMYLLFYNNVIGRWIFKNNNEDNSIKISTVEDYKGLESDVVFYIHDFNTPQNYNYVAYTRAKYYLYELILKK